MRIINKKRITFSALCAVAIIVAAFAIFISVGRSTSQALSTTVGGACGSGYSISIQPSNSGDTNRILSGLVSVDVNIPTNAYQIGQIVISASGIDNQKITIGQAQLLSTGPKWTFKWETALWPLKSRAIKLSANVAYLGNGSCTVDSSDMYYVINDQQANMTVTITGQTAPTYVGSTSIYTVNSVVNGVSSTTIDLTPYRILSWTESTDIGYLSSIPNGYIEKSQIQFNSGNVPGVNTISVKVIYGGIERTESIPVTVKASETTSNGANSTVNSSAPVATTVNPATNDDSTKSIQTIPLVPATTIQLSSSQVQVTPVTKTCVEESLTADRYAAINSGKSRPTAGEVTKMATCFAPSKYILPSNFSPVDPMKVSKLDFSDKVTVSNLENVMTKVDSKDKQTLKITGKAAPNSTVILYVYSDPLVITTQSDSDGNWQYIIEDPLEPGKHEVYSIVDNGDGVYKRSDPMSFLISTASASDTNPNGLGLTLSEPPEKSATGSNTSLIMYIVGSIAALAVGFVGLFFIIRSHNKHKINLAEVNKKVEIDNLACPHCNNLIGDPVKSVVPETPANVQK